MDQLEQQRIQRRTLITIVISQAFGGAGLAAGISVGALIARDVFGSTTWTGLPTGLFTLGAALTAFTVGVLTQRVGRRLALSFGFFAGALGAVGVIVATVARNLPLLMLALLIYGAGTSTNLQARYAGTDLAQPAKRATALSIAMVATTLGAVVGPNLITPLGQLALGLGLPRLTGPFLLAAVAYFLAGLLLFVMLRPDPFLLARSLALRTDSVPLPGGAASAPGSSGFRSFRLVFVGAFVLVISQMVMVGIMTMTPIHMEGHHHGLNEIGLVIGVHVGAMWLPSLVTGMFVDRVGARFTASLSGVLLLTAGLLAGFSPVDDLLLLTVALALLGIGWNLGLVSGSTLVTIGTSTAVRAKTQGAVDVAVNIAGAFAGVTSGVAMSAIGYASLSLFSGVIAMVIVPLLALARSDAKQLARREAHAG